MASRSNDNDGIELLSDAWQNDRGTLTLEHGIIDVGPDSLDWTILNTGFEPDLARRNNSARGEGVVDLGSHDSYINSEVTRRVEFGNATGGVITGGYLFPVGVLGDPRQDGQPGRRNVDLFRPLILQFPDDLGRSSVSVPFSLSQMLLSRAMSSSPALPNKACGIVRTKMLISATW